MQWARVILAMTAATCLSAPVMAQVTPAASAVPPDDTPSVRVGGTLFTDYTYTSDPKITDANGNRVSPN